MPAMITRCRHDNNNEQDETNKKTPESIGDSYDDCHYNATPHSIRLIA